MQNLELHVGKMSGQEIAAWLGISYTTYRKRPKVYQERLADFCVFTPYRGGVEITEVWYKYYHKNFVAETHAKVLAEIRHNPVNTIVSLAQATGFTQYQINKTCNLCFGKMSRACRTSQGIMGMRTRCWGVRLPDGKYRLLSDEEMALFKKCAREHFDWVEEMGTYFDEGAESMSLEEHQMVMTQIQQSFYENVIARFEDAIGYRVVRVTIFEFAHQFTLIGEDKEAADILEAELNKLGIYFERR